MGILFVIAIQCIMIGMFGAVVAAIAVLITLIVSKKESRKRNVWTAIISPFVGLYTLYICGLIGSGIVSSLKNVDIGTGDYWHVPLAENCRLSFIDIPEQAYIEKDEKEIISDVSQLQQIDNKVYGKTSNNRYFFYNTTTNDLKEFNTENELIIHNSGIKPKLMNAMNFYSERRNEVAGFAMIVVIIISLLISVVAIYFSRKLIVQIVSIIDPKQAREIIEANY